MKTLNFNFKTGLQKTFLSFTEGKNSPDSFCPKIRRH